MKSYLIIIVFFSSIVSSYAQEIIKEIDTITVPSVYELKSEQWNDWKKIEDAWKIEYYKILKEQKIKMSCSGCESVFMDVVLSVDNNGKLSYYKLIKSKKCEMEFTKGLEIKFMKWFFTQKFPQSLFNTKFQVRLGTSLKC